MQYRAVLFDLDGTLIDSLEDIADATNRTLAAHGYPVHPTDAYRYFIGDGVRNLLLRALPESARDERSLAEALATYREDYGRLWNVKTRLYEGIPALLDGLSAAGVSLTVLSNKPDEFVQACGRHYLSSWRFEVIMGASARFPHKPDPASALEVARLVGRSPAEFAYLGDMPVDMETARRAGMLAVGAGWGLRGGDELRAAGADHVIARPEELLAITAPAGR